LSPIIFFFILSKPDAPYFLSTIFGEYLTR
jgi:hypothetical protein